MRHRLILGRQAISGRFLIDSSRSFLHPIASAAAQKNQTESSQEISQP
jgi:hypothetical protein